jgi:hypothetical protein
MRTDLRWMVRILQLSPTATRWGEKAAYDGVARQIQELERANARLRHKLERAKLIIDAQQHCVALDLPTANDRSGDA